MSVWRATGLATLADSTARPGGVVKTKPKPSAMAELKTAATKYAHHLMKAPPESFEVRARCRIRTKALLASRRLVRTACEGCGAEPVQAHHENYRRPDHVRWVCRRCHDAVHHRGAVLPAKLPPNPTDDEVCRFVVLLGLETVVKIPEPAAPKAFYVPKAEALVIGGLSNDELRKAVLVGEVKQRGRRYRRTDLEAL